MQEYELRVYLIIVALMIVLYIYLYDRNHKKNSSLYTKENDLPSKKIKLKSDSEYSGEKIKPVNEINIKTNNEIEQLYKKEVYISPKQKSFNFEHEKNEAYIILYSKAKSFYYLKDINKYFNDKNFFINEFSIFQKNYSSVNLRSTMYYVSDMYKPGHLEIGICKKNKILGLSFILSLPVKLDGLTVFRDMVKEAKRFTKLYNGTLTNDKNKKLTKGVIQSISENIINIESTN